MITQQYLKKEENYTEFVQSAFSLDGFGELEQHLFTDDNEGTPFEKPWEGSVGNYEISMIGNNTAEIYDHWNELSITVENRTDYQDFLRILGKGIEKLPGGLDYQTYLALQNAINKDD